MNQERKNEKGFTMVELIIVVAIMGIIGALLVPSFGNMAAKTKISTDISTTKTIKRLIDSYNVERSTPIANNADITAIQTALFDAGYLETKTINLQTNGGLVYIAADPSTGKASQLKLDLSSVTDANIKTVATNMATDNMYKDWLKVS